MQANEATAEQWLKAAETALRPAFTRAGLDIPRDIRYAVAFPGAGARGNTLGECWYQSSSSDHRHTIILRTDLVDRVEVLAVLIHELIHASLPSGTKHGPLFKRKATALTLGGAVTATVPTQATRLLVDSLCHFTALGALGALGDPPWGRLNFHGTADDRPKKQGTRMLKAYCPACDYMVRLTRSACRERLRPRARWTSSTLQVRGHRMKKKERLRRMTEIVAGLGAWADNIERTI